MNVGKNKSKLFTWVARTTRPFFKDCLWQIETSNKEIFLSFDDGPDPKSTPIILDTLDRHHAKAAFFLIGQKAEEYPELVNDILDRGHQIGNHSFMHRDPWKLKKEDLIVSFERTQEVLKSVMLEFGNSRVKEFNNKNIPIRPPYGHLNRHLNAWAKKHHLNTIMRDLDPCDYLEQSNQIGVAERIVKNARPGSIVLLHDRDDLVNTTAPALERAMSVLKKEGWSFPNIQIKKSQNMGAL